MDTTELVTLIAALGGPAGVAAWVKNISKRLAQLEIFQVRIDNIEEELDRIEGTLKEHREETNTHISELRIEIKATKDEIMARLGGIESKIDAYFLAQLTKKNDGD